MTSDGLKALADDLDLDIRYKGSKPLKPDLLYEVEFHVALERFEAGEHPLPLSNISIVLRHTADRSLPSTALGIRTVSLLLLSHLNLGDLHELFIDEIEMMRAQAG